MIIRAVVTTTPKKGIAVLQWRELLGERLVKGFDTDEFIVPRYGRTLASIERPAQEFYEHIGSLEEYVESHLPRPKGKNVGEK